MSVGKNFVKQELTGANAVLYTVRPAKKAEIKHITVINTSNTDSATWYLYLVDSGTLGDSGDSNVLINGETLVANQRKEFCTWKVLHADGVICGYKAGSGSVTIHIDGAEVNDN